MNSEVADEIVEEPQGIRAKLSVVGKKAARSAASIETRFLSLLRYSALAFASIALVTSGVLLSLGATRQFGRTVVEPEKVFISANDVVPQKVSRDQARVQDEPKSRLPKSIRDRTASIYRNDFAQHQRQDTKISEDQAVDLVWTDDRIAQFEDLASAGLTDANGRELVGKEMLMSDALDTVSNATATNDYVAQLVGYRDAKKANICANETRTRRRTVQGWNSYSTNCSYFWESPVGCPTTRIVTEPYVERVCAMKYPEELKAPAELLAASIQQYADVADAELYAAEIASTEKTAENHQRKVKGVDNIGMSGKLFLAFLATMFLYLFIAMERHNRNLRALMSKDES